MSEGNYYREVARGNNLIRCNICKKKVQFIGGGKYKCNSCGNIVLDDFGKVKEFLEENGPSPSIIISTATGVSTQVIEQFLKEGRIEIPKGSSYFIKCEKCGASIRYGRYCNVCIKQLAGAIKGVFDESAKGMTRVEWVDKNEKPEKMYFLDRKK